MYHKERKPNFGGRDSVESSFPFAKGRKGAVYLWIRGHVRGYVRRYMFRGAGD